MLPESITSLPHADLEDVESAVKYWNGSASVRKRLELGQQPPASIVLFLEHIPTTLGKWLPEQIAHGGEVARSAVSLTEGNLLKIISFLRSKNFIHFDAHFRNILVHDHELYLTDFGLASCTQFSLSSSETKCIQSHLTYDRCFTITSLVYRIAIGLFGAQNCDRALQDYAEGISRTGVEPWAEGILVRYSPIAKVMTDFLQKFKSVARTTPYPVDELNDLLTTLELT